MAWFEYKLGHPGGYDTGGIIDRNEQVPLTGLPADWVIRQEEKYLMVGRMVNGDFQESSRLSVGKKGDEGTEVHFFAPVNGSKKVLIHSLTVTQSH